MTKSSSSNFSSSTESGRIIHKILFLHIPILFALYILTDNETFYNDDDNNDNGASYTNNTDQIQNTEYDIHHHHRHHLAVITALQRHPPSRRIFRCLLEFVLLGLCVSWSIWVWEGVVGKDVLGRLMFDVPYTLRHSADCDNDDDDGGGGTKIEMVSLTINDNGDSNNDVDCEDDRLPTDDQKIETDDDQSHSDDEFHIRSPIKKRPEPRAPRPLYICNASLDILLLILTALFLFTISSSSGGIYIDQTKSQSVVSHMRIIAARTFPLLLFVYLTIRCLLPWTRTKQYVWTVLAYTFGAPAYKVTFRDGMIGDVLTSMVRPMQDLAYTFFYLAMGLQGWFTIRNSSSSPDHFQPAVERSWFLHTMLLPALAISPLWWRFCQCLRQTYVHRKRWPYLGNAAKYFVAAGVAVAAVYEPGMRETLRWKVSAVVATMYQIWWDVFMDWELLEVKEMQDDAEQQQQQSGRKNYSMSGTGTTTTTTTTARRWFPLVKLRLRSQRLYPSTSMYIIIAILNTILRFGWTLTFVPDRYLAPSSGILMRSFTGIGADLREMIDPMLAGAEILRRTLWGFLRLELEALKVKKEQSSSYHRQTQSNELKDLALEMEGDTTGMEPMLISSGVKSYSSNTAFLWSDMSASDDARVLWELCFYATVFTSLGILAGYHRQVY